MITFKTSGNFRKTETYLEKLRSGEIYRSLGRYGQEGVNALAAATPKDSGETANSWTYEIKRSRQVYSITWLNTNVVNGVPIAIILQYGHGTGTGGYVQGRDYINPALKPIFAKIAESVRKAVTSA